MIHPLLDEFIHQMSSPAHDRYSGIKSFTFDKNFSNIFLYIFDTINSLDVTLWTFNKDRADCVYISKVYNYESINYDNLKQTYTKGTVEETVLWNYTEDVRDILVPILEDHFQTELDELWFTPER